MKITPKKDSETSLPREMTRVVFAEHIGTRFVETAEGTTLSLGIKKDAPSGRREYFARLRRIVREARSHRITLLAIDIRYLRDKHHRLSDSELLGFATENWIMADFEFDQFKQTPKEGRIDVSEIVVLGIGESKSIRTSINRARIVADSVNTCRTLANTPAGIMTPLKLAEDAKEIMRGLGNTKVSILRKADLERLEAGAILGVAKGSNEEPCIIVIEYSGGNIKNRPIAFVGKGVTFDSGGLNIKPSSGGSLEDMHLDMSGGAAVISAISAIARLGLKRNVIGIIPAVENMVSGSSYRPGDILKSMSGKTIEVLNTDAEGRLILADALTYVQKKFNPAVIIDVATLTGAALIALGQAASAVLSNNHRLLNTVERLANESGDFVWPFPLWNVYKEAIESTRADLANVPQSQNRYGGVINAAIFLEAFVNEKQPWLHIDMAPRMKSISSDNLATGATGEPVRLLVRFAEKYR